MKRHGHLWEGMIAFEHLLKAAEKARRGKRFRPAATRFFFHLERELTRLHEELASKTYCPGPYRTFTIYEGKKRQISAAPFRDRVVHHALTGALEPIFERSFIADSYACRKGKGTHAAVDRCQAFAHRHRYVLKADVRKFFPSIDHAILKGLVARKIKDPHVLWLVDRIVDHSNPQDPVLMWFPGDDLFTPTERRRGLPLGNQTSQFFANVYLDPLDHFVTDRLGLSYVRYVDDFLVFADDKTHLHAVKQQVEPFLAGLRLQIHGDKSVVFPCTQGIRFLGYRVFPTHRRLVPENVRRFRRRMRRMQREFAAGRIGFDAIRPRIMSWIGHARHADTYRLRADLFARMPFQRAAAMSSPASGRDVQQSTVERPLGVPQQERAVEP
jgi:retron-type reverse transcriptase